MSVLHDVLEWIPFAEEDEEELPSFPDFNWLFFDIEARLRSRPPRTLYTISEEDEEEEATYDAHDDQDDDDAETIIWITPRPKPRMQGLEEPEDEFSLEELPSPTASTSSSSSGSSSGSSNSDPRNAPTGLMGSDRPATERELTNLTEEDGEDEWVDIEEEGEEAEDEIEEDEKDDDSSKDSSAMSSDDEDDSILTRLFNYERLLGHEFVYINEAYFNNAYDSNMSIEEIVYGVRRTCETYAAAMKLYLKWVDLEDAERRAEARLVLIDIQTAVSGAMEEWIGDNPEDNWPLGRARVALIGQLIRLEIFPDSYVSQFITRLGDDITLDGRMQVLQALIHYAGPGAINETNLDALDIVADICRRRPELYTMRWVFSKIKKDVTAYMIRNRLTEKHDCRYSQGELEELLRETLGGDESDSLLSLLNLVLDQRDKRIIANLIHSQNETSSTTLRLDRVQARQHEEGAV